MSGDLTLLLTLKLFFMYSDKDHDSSVMLTVPSYSQVKQSLPLNSLSFPELLSLQLGSSLISSETVVRRCSSKKVFKKILAEFAGKHMCWSLYLTTLQAFRLVNLFKKDSNTDVFLRNLQKFQNATFYRRPPVAASASICNEVQTLK